jgi:uncharacterized protein YuzE
MLMGRKPAYISRFRPINLEGARKCDGFGGAITVVRMEEYFAYWDREYDIAWIQTAPAESVTSERTSWGIVDHDRETGRVAGLEILDASKFVSAEIVERLPPGPIGKPSA